MNERMTKRNALTRLGNLLNLEKQEISSIYFFAIFSGLVQLSLPLGVQTIVGLMLGTTMVTSIYILVIGVVVGVFMVGWLQISQMRVIEKIQQRLFTRFAFEFATVIPKLKLNQTDDYYLPEKANRFFDTVTVQKGLAKLLLDVPMAGIQIGFGLILLALYHPAFIMFGVALVVILWLILKATSRYGLETSLIESKYKYLVAGWLEEIARIVIPLKYSKTNNINLERTDNYLVGYLKARTKHFGVLLLQYKTLVFFKVAITLTMLAVGSYLVINQQINIGEFIAAEIVILTVIGAVEKLIGSLDNVYDVITGLEKLATVTELPTESSGSLKLADNANGLSITLQNVSYGYIKEQPVLNSVNVDIPENSKIWITGNEGSGKSTLLKVMAGCFDDYQGKLLYNNIPFGNYDIKSLRNQISLYLNNNDLFLGTVLENITLRNQETSPQEILELANKLGMEGFLNSFNRGFDTLIDPMGKKLTESTLKKIMMLRTFGGNRKLIILNEPFVGVDDYTKHQTLAYINSLKNTTLLLVSNDTEVKVACTHKLSLEKGMVSKLEKIN
jgi:ABC-type bacteriocin/lantibiotic exporter with double-glycine peptidase domain